ncbi:MAG: hypothetical protein SOY83_03735 [Anaerovoracaceae bacterium]|nr:hypothetical protein [Bacillota bacterium]MDY3954577.1 hypothetical protein [Anaerovoracaceae bacterium]
MDDTKIKVEDFTKGNCNACGHHCGELSALIAQGKAKPEDCVRYNADFELFLDGEPLPLAPFIREMLRGGILGMAQALKGMNFDSEIKIIIRPEKNK